jgi:hypothetical protein
MTNLGLLARHLKAKPPYMVGPWVEWNSGCEMDFAGIIDANISEKGVKFWDCTCPNDSEAGLGIEVKKCKAHSWLNLLTCADYQSRFREHNKPVAVFLFCVRLYHRLWNFPQILLESGRIARCIRRLMPKKGSAPPQNKSARHDILHPRMF